MQTKKAANLILNIVLEALFSYSLVLALLTSLGLNISPVGTFSIIALMLVFYTLIFFSRTTMKISAAVLGSLFGLTIAFSLFSKLFKKFFTFTADLFAWLQDVIAIGMEDDARFGAAVLLATCLIVSLAVFLLSNRKLHFVSLLAVGAAVFVSQWMLDFFVSYAAFYIFLSTSLLMYFMHIYGKNSRCEDNEFAEPAFFTVWALPIAAAILVLSLVIPSRDKPIEWKWMDNKIAVFSDFLSSKFDSSTFDYFSLASTGFGSKGGKLGGKVSLDKTVVLKVDSPRMIYLKGSSHEVYNGLSWEDSSTKTLSYNDTTNESRMDLYETMLGMRLLTNEYNYQNKYFYKDKIKVTYVNLKTKSLFIPAKTESLEDMDGGSIDALVDSNGIMSTINYNKKDFEYWVNVYTPKFSESGLSDILRKSKTGLYAETLNRLGRSGSTFHQMSMTMEQLMALKAHADSIYSRYVQLPSTLPQRVKDAAAAISASSSNNYDKVKSIEEYLSRNYPYTLDTGNTPRGRDFVDYFLFDLKKGYCSYYASAMTVMVRSLGIPARYVEGYILPPVPTSGTLFDVTNEQAHAWVEVYFEGFGWIPFEPTSPFGSAFYNNMDRSALYSEDFANDPEMQEYINELEQYSGETDTDTFSEAAGDSKPSSAPLIVIAAVILLLLLCTVLTNYIKLRLSLQKMLNQPPKDSVLSLYNRFVKLLSLQGFAIAPGETPFQYSERIDRYFLFRSSTFRSITEVFTKARYSTLEINETEKQLVSDFNSIITERSILNMGRLKYFIHTCLLRRL